MVREKKVLLPPSIKIGERKLGWRLSDLIEAQKQRQSA
jgi:predicted DNA-binding transcriptional regulator AlpA